MRPDFSHINLKSSGSGGRSSAGKDWLTPEHIPVKSAFSKDDLLIINVSGRGDKDVVEVGRLLERVGADS